MIFQQEFDHHRLFTAASPTPTPVYSQKSTNLTREERILLRRREKRRKQIKELRAGCKRFMAMLFSHIGLSGVVIAYTIVGALLFGGIELEYEKQVKEEAKLLRRNNTWTMMRIVFRELDRWLDLQEHSCNQTQKLIRSVIDFVDQTQTKALEAAEAAANKELNNSSLVANTTFAGLSEETSNMSTILDTNVTTTTVKTTTPIPLISIDPLVIKTFTEMEGAINRQSLVFIKNIVHYIEEKGWNGNESKDDLKWSIAGAILYAITVITTIGYGHTTPRTDLGKIVTIFYALIGIPLVFLYLSNIGDYLAHVFRLLYSRTCRTTCESYCSISLIYSVVQKFIKRHRLRRDSETTSEDAPHLDVTNAIHQHGQFRRRKRVLLRTITTTTAEEEEEDGGEEVTGEKQDGDGNAENGMKGDAQTIGNGTRNNNATGAVARLLASLTTHARSVRQWSGFNRMFQSPKVNAAVHVS